MGNVHTVSKKFKKFSSFFDENWPENDFWQQQSLHTAQLNGAPSVNAKTLAFRSLVFNSVFKCFRQKRAGEKVSSPDFFGLGQL